ncbi:hypothetical protein JVT61DRAFT_14862 [Boletus reticuloceps]|uniref:CxC2-like cysteine cluster KDZ transposase-associated domain-containing protein n=1 Tax=Boletus reticuloceps TaxID=495285 RepID=A0A8I3A3Y0_9AGAM|nr:hypothetical protein JVT61DRAFT_14862 [Boletus reticuloceps]
MVKKMRSSSGRVKMTVMSASGVTQTSIATLTRIRKDRIEAEQRFLEEAGMFFPILSVPFVDGTLAKARCLQERLTEARLEVGDHSEDAVDDTAWNYEVDEQLSGEQWTGDDCMDDYENMEDLPNCFSKYFTPGVHVLPVSQRENELPNAALIQAGLLGCSPIQPVTAIKLECLEFYHQLRRRQSSFSVQAMVKVLCALHNTSYTRHLRNQFAAAFDVYLAIKRHIQTTLRQALNRHGLAWRLTHACPPCTFKVSAESTLSPARLHAMDGNFSAKRLDGSGSADPRIFESDYFIPTAEVERFRNNARKECEKATNDRAVTCSNNWSAAKSVEEEKIHVFEQTGIFVLACRHGFVECIAEMKRSGELQVSVFSISQILDFCDDDHAIGHDIGCASRITVAKSALGGRAKEAGLRVVVNAFHGFAHNRLCQLENHPLYLPGFGNEDLETCERIFSSSNSTAPLIRHHHFSTGDNSFIYISTNGILTSRFLYNNYKQALNIVNKYTVQLVEFKALTNFDNKDFETWHQEELMYLKDCESEPATTSISIAYVAELEKLQFAEKSYASVTQSPYLTYTPTNFTAESGLNYITRQCSNAMSAEYSSARRKYELQLNVVEHFERQHGIETRWSPDNPEYVGAAEYAKHRNFIRVVEELEGLVVQRLFELSKANLAGTGYKMRRHISKALTRRALGEFSLLKISRSDVLSKPWAQPANREMLIKYFKVLRSKEEIIRLNVEIRRLAAWVDQDEKDIAAAEEIFRETGSDGLATETRLFYAERHRVNNIHRQILCKIYQMDGYSGQMPEGRTREEGGHVNKDSNRDSDDVEEEDEEDEDEEGASDVINLSACLERIN